ncbi:hypothetical protein HOT31_gp140 [Microbacterium phage Hendrix]|uniref:Uncharacterized protein n=1 Tax=Microbacterium phage Hendrix TaxID=2182341 RepID=A0A2U8UUH3_9CAUD|nr:hypothetical protein HOT31_gp140 [Microbacterium phage Hendrix]AWN07810.1 hypothetical protein PBI_HENDRIX_139 [Microbacterium phage Hendrix]
MTGDKKSAASLEEGDFIYLHAPGEEAPSTLRRPVRVDHIKRMPYGVVRIYHSLYGLQHVDAAGAHRFLLGDPW